MHLKFHIRDVDEALTLIFSERKTSSSVKVTASDRLKVACSQIMSILLLLAKKMSCLTSVPLTLTGKMTMKMKFFSKKIFSFRTTACISQIYVKSLMVLCVL